MELSQSQRTWLSSTLNGALIACCVRRGQAHRIQELLRLGASVNCRLADEPDGDTPLLAATRYSNVDAISVLLAVPGLDMKLRGEDDQTALQQAISDNNHRVTAVLKAARATRRANPAEEPTVPSDPPETSVEALEVVASLLAPVGRTTATDDAASRASTILSSSEEKESTNEPSPLWLAVKAHDLPTIRTLLQSGARPDAKLMGYTPFINAAIMGQLDTINIMLECCRIPLDLTTDEGMTANDWACVNSHFDVVDRLLVAGARPPHDVFRMFADQELSDEEDEEDRGSEGGSIEDSDASDDEQ